MTESIEAGSFAVDALTPIAIGPMKLQAPPLPATTWVETSEVIPLCRPAGWGCHEVLFLGLSSKPESKDFVRKVHDQGSIA